MTEQTTPETAREAHQTLTALSDALTTATPENESTRENHSIAAHERLVALRENFETVTAELSLAVTHAVASALSTAIKTAKRAIQHSDSPTHFRELSEAVGKILKAYNDEWEPETPDTVQTARRRGIPGE